MVIFFPESSTIPVQCTDTTYIDGCRFSGNKKCLLHQKRIWTLKFNWDSGFQAKRIQFYYATDLLIIVGAQRRVFNCSNVPFSLIKVSVYPKLTIVKKNIFRNFQINLIETFSTFNLKSIPRRKIDSRQSYHSLNKLPMIQW